MPRALAINMPTGFIDAAMVPAIRIRSGELGSVAANIRMITPIQVIAGATVGIITG